MSGVCLLGGFRERLGALRANSEVVLCEDHRLYSNMRCPSDMKCSFHQKFFGSSGSGGVADYLASTVPEVSSGSVDHFGPSHVVVNVASCFVQKSTRTAVRSDVLEADDADDPVTADPQGSGLNSPMDAVAERVMCELREWAELHDLRSLEGCSRPEVGPLQRLLGDRLAEARAKRKLAISMRFASKRRCMDLAEGRSTALLTTAIADRPDSGVGGMLPSQYR